MKKKNILYILVDQQRFDMLGAYGHTYVKTPNIDKLADDGILFNNAFTPSSICGPARTSLFTGCVPTTHGVTQNAENGHNRFQKADPLPHIPTIGDYLIDYEKIYLGKWHISESKLPSDYGFKGHNFPGYGFPGSRVYKNMVFDQGPGEKNRYVDWLNENNFEIPTVSESFCGLNQNLQLQELRGKLSGSDKETIPAFLCDEAITYLDNRDKDKPFFMWLNFWGPHTPCVIPEPYYSMYNPADIEQDKSFIENFKIKPIHQKHISYMWGVHDLNWEGWSKIIACYFGYISLIDHYIGELISTLKDKELYDDTTIVFTADHGDAMGAHKLIEKGEFMYDETYKIPFIVKSPFVSNPGTECNDFIYLHDLFPTAIEIAGQTVPDLKQAQSIIPLLSGKKLPVERSYVYGQFTGHFTDFNQRMIRTKEFKFIFNAPTKGELYDLKNDPDELYNLIDDQKFKDIKIELIDLLLKEMETVDDPIIEWVKRIKDIY